MLLSSQKSHFLLAVSLAFSVPEMSCCLWEAISNCRSHQYLAHIPALLWVRWPLYSLSVCHSVSLHLYSLCLLLSQYLPLSLSSPFLTLFLCFIIFSSVSLSLCLSVPFRRTLKPPSGANKAPWHSISCLPRTSLLYVLLLLFSDSFCVSWIGGWMRYWTYRRADRWMRRELGYFFLCCVVSLPGWSFNSKVTLWRFSAFFLKTVLWMCLGAVSNKNREQRLLFSSFFCLSYVVPDYTVIIVTEIVMHIQLINLMN